MAVVFLEPAFVGRDDAESVAAFYVVIRYLEIHAIDTADVAVVGALKVAAQQREGEGVASDAGAEIALLLVSPADSEHCEQSGPCFVSEAGEFPFRRGGLLPGGEFGQVLASDDEAESVVVRGQSAQKGAQAVVAQLAGPGVLQRFEAVEDERGAVLADELGEALAFSPRAGVAGGEGGVAEEFKALLQEQVGEGSVACAVTSPSQRVPWL